MLNKNQKRNKKENVGLVNGLLMNPRREGLTRTIIKVPVKLLMIDERYQTPVRTDRNMSYLIKNWNEHKLLPLTVVPHDEEGVFAIVDGYGRFQASQKVDSKKYEELDCLVILDAPKEPEERLVFEAEEYAFQNRDVARMKPIHRHGAGQVMGDQAVLILDKMKEKYGFEYVDVPGKRSASKLGSYTECLRIAKVHGSDCLNYIFSIIKAVGFDRQTNGYSRCIVRSLKDMYVYYEEQRKETSKYFKSRLRGISPDLLKADAKAKYPMVDVEVAVSLYCEDIAVEELELQRMRMVDENNKVVKIA